MYQIFSHTTGGSMVSSLLGERFSKTHQTRQSANVWFDLRLTTGDGTHIQHCVGDQEPDWIAQKPRVKSDTDLEKKSKKLLDILLYPQINTLSRHHQEASSPWGQAQRPTASRYVERESKRDFFIRSLLSGLRKPLGRGHRKTVRTRGDGGHWENNAL